jgi:glycyl-tRNA synthetase alpha chain
VELTYGMERLCMFLNDIRSIFEIPWARAEWNSEGIVRYGELRRLSEREQSLYAFEEADVDEHRRQFEHAEAEARRLLQRERDGAVDPLLIPAYERVLEASHLFNVLDARSALSVTERQGMIQRIRRLAVACAREWLSREESGGGRHAERAS